MKQTTLFFFFFFVITSYCQAQQWQAEDTFAFAQIKLVHPDNSGYTGNIELISTRRGKKYTATLSKGSAKVKLPFDDTYTVRCQGIDNYKKLEIGNYPYVTHSYSSYTYRFAWVLFHYQNPAGEPIPNEIFYAKGINQDTVYTAVTNQKGDAKLLVPFEDAYSLSVAYRLNFEVIRARELGQPYTTIMVKLVWKGSKALEMEKIMAQALADSLKIDSEQKHQAYLIQQEKDRIKDSIHYAIKLYSKETKYFEEIIKLNDSKIIDVRNSKLPFSKEAVLADFKKNLLDKSMREENLGWTGSVDNCQKGTISEGAKATFLAQINYFRRMAGVWDGVVWSQEKNEHCQECALMSAANGTINHHPPSKWSCYSNDGASACGYSNLSLGSHTYGLGHIAMYIEDFGDNNHAVGHRRWLINPSGNEMGIGATPDGTAVAVFPNYTKPYHKETRDPFVAWPPRGYIPEQIIYPRWSFGAEDAYFDNAIVEMLDKDGQKINIKILSLSSGFGLPTIVWEPAFQRMKKGERYEVIISNVKVLGQRYVYRYWVEAI